jgi:hypothetical protein
MPVVGDSPPLVGSGAFQVTTLVELTEHFRGWRFAAEKGLPGLRIGHSLPEALHSG